MLTQATIEAFNEQAAFFDRAVALGGRPRERLVALNEAEALLARLHRQHCPAGQVQRALAPRVPVGVEQRGAARRCETHLIELLTSVILDALGAGDLELVDPGDAEDVAFTLWTLAFGMRAQMDTMAATAALGNAAGLRSTRDATDVLLDALGWRPLSSEWDYERTRQRIRREVFSRDWDRPTAA